MRKARDLLSLVLGGEGWCGEDMLVWVMLSCSLVGVGVVIVVAVVDGFELVSFCCDGDTVVLCQRAVVDKVELVSFCCDVDITVLYQRAVVDEFELVSFCRDVDIIVLYQRAVFNKCDAISEYVRRSCATV